jgi:type II secretory pathway component PulC
MRAMKRLTPTFLALSLAACAPSLQSNTSTDEPAAGSTRSNSEQELNRAALEELRERAASAPASEASAPAEPAPASALRDDGSLRRAAVQAFIARGPHALLGSVTLEPQRSEGGAMLGFRIDAIEDGGAFVMDGGLRVGDVVSRVNGHDITAPDEFMAAWDAIPEADRLVVEARRNGEALTLEWPIRDEE